IHAHFTGVDLKADCIAYAREKSMDYPEIHFVQSDYRDYAPEQAVDIAFSSLFCHHLSTNEMLEYLHWMKSCSRHFFINDLHRNKIAESAIGLLTSLFSKSYLVKNDAPASVRRGWIRREWQELLEQSDIQAEISWQWAFRWRIQSI
ncbi:MAG: methyltransferase domain-containing protein, partial [Bacteroidota bacterium]|nr:methyltransferase domain-containing protein [Bacteroidota bacterium]MDX5430448.1 methyltransferase domain-containing protein [Bacteroidota bacterium]MDX5469207.1 methyltransferase domain-containing protein [Bacteroidota bacterium]